MSVRGQADNAQGIYIGKAALKRYADQSLTWTHGEKTEDELLQRIWNLANDVKRLVAASASDGKSA